MIQNSAVNVSWNVARVIRGFVWGQSSAATITLNPYQRLRAAKSAKRSNNRKAASP